MRHHKNNRKFGLEKNARTALMRSLLRSLILHEKITTTEPKAKELRPKIEKLITVAKKGTMASQRILLSRIAVKDASDKIFKEIAPKYKGRSGGYTRITKLVPRKSDGAKMAVIEFV